MTVTLVIQAGGRSSRMGRDKGLVLLAGKPMVEHIIDRVGDLGDEILITTNSPEAYAYLNLPLASDPLPGAGALPGLHTALAAAPGDIVLLVACDMPFLNRGLLAHQLSLAGTADVVVPFWEGNFQTMHAIYRRKTVLLAVTAALAAGQKRMISFYNQIAVRQLGPEEVARFDPGGLTFFNVNTPEELAAAEEMLRQGLDNRDLGSN